MVPVATWDDRRVRAPDLLSPAPAPPTGRRRRALLTRAALAVLVATVVSGCGVHFEASPGVLPELTGIDAARDAAVRVDEAAGERARQLADKATACEECREALIELSEASDARVEALGGVWDPWEGQTPDGAEDPEPIADAPMEPHALVSWLAATATRDLTGVADDALVSGEDARMVGAVAAGRLASAIRLADAYGVELSDGDAEFRELATRLRDQMDRAGEGWLGWGLGEDADPALTLDRTAVPTDSADAQASEELAGAVRTWDCVAQELVRLQVVDGAIDDATSRADVLLTRSSEVLGAGVADVREQRCRLAEPDGGFDVTALDALVLSADLDVLTSSSTTVRGVGAQLITEDVERQAASGEIGTAAVLGVSPR